MNDETNNAGQDVRCGREGDSVNDAMGWEGRTRNDVDVATASAKKQTTPAQARRDTDSTHSEFAIRSSYSA